MIDFLLSAVPILLILALMIGLRWKSTRAGVTGWIAAVLIAALQFGAGAQLLFWAQVRAFFLALPVLYIIWGALLFYRVTEAAGVIEAMATLLTRISPHRAFHVLLLAWGFASFLQSVGGYGVPVAVVAPLLVGMGFPPLASFVMTSLGHTWAISFGSLGASFQALRNVTDISSEVSISIELAFWSTVLLGILCLIMGVAALWVAGGKTALKQGLAPMLVMGVVMAGIQWLAATRGMFNTAAMLGALAGLLVGVLWAIAQKRPTFPNGPGIYLRKALLPYGLLLLLIFSADKIPPLKTLLNTITLQVSIPAVSTTRGWMVSADETPRIALFGHIGALLIYATLLTWWQGRRSGQITAAQSPHILRKVAHSGFSSTIGILSMVALSTTMDNGGMITVLAEGIAHAAGGLFPLVAPFIGALGAFVTGSNTNANALFGALQRDIAQTLGYAVPVILAAQNAGGALGSTFAPAKVVVGCSTVGLEAQEGEAMRALLRYDLIALGLIAGLTLALAQFR